MRSINLTRISALNMNTHAYEIRPVDDPSRFFHHRRGSKLLLFPTRRSYLYAHTVRPKTQPFQQRAHRSSAPVRRCPSPGPDRTGHFLRVMTRRYTRPEFGKFSRPPKQRHLRSVCVPEGGLLVRDSLTDRRGRRTKLDSARRGRCRSARARSTHRDG